MRIEDGNAATIVAVIGAGIVAGIVICPETVRTIELIAKRIEDKDVREMLKAVVYLQVTIRRNRLGKEDIKIKLFLVRKQKKKEDPPLRLLDDLFRKTKATPCIYWLPLTPEQVSLF